jgi:hypothetical protein
MLKVNILVNILISFFQSSLHRFSCLMTANHYLKSIVNWLLFPGFQRSLRSLFPWAVPICTPLSAPLFTPYALGCADCQLETENRQLRAGDA